MTAEAWIAFAGLAVTILLAIVTGAFQSGKHSARLSALEDKSRAADANVAQLAVLTAAVGGIETRLSEVAHDVKDLLTNRARVGRRSGEG